MGKNDKVMYALEHTAHHNLKIRSLQSGEGPCVIVANGFLSQDELVPEHLWQPLLQQCFPQHPWSFLDWESKTTREFYQKISQPMNQPHIQQKLAALATAANKGKLSEAKSLIEQMAKDTGVDRLWTSALTNAQQAGQFLGQRIHETASMQKFILLGYSLGSAVITHTLQTLLTFHEKKVHSVHFLAGAVSTKQAWDRLASMVSMGIHNYHSANDRVLSMGYNQLLSEGCAIGSSAIESPHPRVYDHDVTRLVLHHRDYIPKAAQFLIC